MKAARAMEQTLFEFLPSGPQQIRLKPFPLISLDLQATVASNTRHCQTVFLGLYSNIVLFTRGASLGGGAACGACARGSRLPSCGERDRGFIDFRVAGKLSFAILGDPHGLVS
jgi:hypothetical protein